MDIEECTVSVKDCIITGNTGYSGAGAEVESSTVEFVNCTFRNNTADREGGGLFIGFGSNSVIDSCTIENNTAGWAAGIEAGIGNHLIMNTIIRNNHCTAIGGPGGGGMDINGSTQIINCLVYGNTASEGAQIEKTRDASVVFSNCTVQGETGGVAWVFTSVPATPPSFHNCILWGSPSLLSGEGQAEVTHSAVQGGYTGTGNISDDPLFIDPASGNYRLQPESPCIDSAGTSGPSDDLDGNPRPADAPGLGRDNTGDEYDMGAYEYQPPVPTPIPTEILLPTPTMDPRSDINQSGKVDTEDLLLLIADWARQATP